MDAKEFLEQYRAADMRIRAMEDQLRRLDMDDGYHSPGYDRLPGPIGQTPTPAADLAEKRIDLRASIMAARAEQIWIQTEIFRTLLQLEGPECEVLTLRYIDDLSWDDIGERLHYSRRWLFDTHRRGIDQVQKILDDSKSLH